MIDLKNAIHLALEPAPGSGAGRAAQDAATIAHWKTQLPGVPLYKAHVDGTLLLFRAAPDETAKALILEPAGQRPPEALQQDMVRACLLHPRMDDLAELAQHRPLLMMKLMVECLAICGFGDDQNFKRADR
jgi:hypothetical protein